MRQFLLPDLGMDVEEATISFWHAEVGEHIKQGQDILEVTTDKANINIPSPCEGVLAEIIAVEGQTVQSGELLAMIQEEE